MKKTFLLFAAIALISAAFFTGCAKKPAEGEASASVESGLKPNEVVEKVLNGFQTGEVAGVSGYFSPVIEKAMIDSFIKNKIAKFAVIQFEVGKVKASGKTANVDYVYIYQGKKKDGTVDYRAKRNKATYTARLVQEKAGWKIVRFDPDLNRRIENTLFLSCVKTVAVARLSQEQFFGKNGTYTRSLSDLRQFTDFNRDACRSIDVASAGPDFYRIVAVPDTDVECRITADLKGIKPLKFSACRPSRTVAKKPLPATVKAKEVQPTQVKVVIEQPPEETR